jgi:unsaturated rhamnogalacturonyl hydrolase
MDNGRPASFIHHVNRRDTELLRAVFRRTLQMWQPPGAELIPGAHLNAWDWGPGIALYGLHRAYPHLDPPGQQEFLSFWRDWLDHFLDKNEPVKTINGAILLTVMWRASFDPSLPLESWERESYRAYCKKRARFYMTNADRLPSGVFGHTVAGIPESAQQVWADNLFMLVLFLANRAVSLDEPDDFRQMVRQVDLHYYHLFDPATNLLWHGWDNSPQPRRGALWGRGNGWAALGVAELLELCRKPGFEEFGEPILKAARAHFRALLTCQRQDGRWNTVLNRESYPETSVTAALSGAFLKGALLGALGPEFAESGKRALEALRGQISPEGEVQGVSGSTPLLDSVADYNAIPAGQIRTWGQGLALLALSESLNS